MKCRCGYSYIEAEIKGASEGEHFAVVKNEDYMAFLRAEMKTVAAKKKGSHLFLKSIIHSSTYVGCALICPVCNRLTLISPGGTRKRYYKLESEDVD